MSQWTFEDAHRVFRLIGASTLAHHSAGGATIEVWASETLSGRRKGAPVLRVQWPRSESTINEFQWDEPDSAMVHRVKNEIVQFFEHAEASLLRQAFRRAPGGTLAKDDIDFLVTCLQIEPKVITDGEDFLKAIKRVASLE